jgi:hypothetical protein
MYWMLPPWLEPFIEYNHAHGLNINEYGIIKGELVE